MELWNEKVEYDETGILKGVQLNHQSFRLWGFGCYTRIVDASIWRADC